MANDKIASGSVILSANADRLGPGLKRAEDQVQGWGGRVKGIFKSAFAGGLSGGILGAGVVGSVRAVTDSFRGLMDELETVSRSGAAAKAFGLTPEQFTGIAGVAASVGEQQREFIESLVTLGKVASEGAAGTGQVATQWFQSLNLNAQEFKNLRLDEQFFTVFEAIKRVEDPASRVRALMVAFGEDGGKYLLPLLSKAPEEIRAMAKGFAVSAEQVEKATEANQAWIAANADIKRAIREIAVELAPAAKSFLENFISPAAEKASKLADSFERARVAIAGMPGGDKPSWLSRLVPDDIEKGIPEAENFFQTLAVGATMTADSFEDAAKQVDDFSEKWFGIRPNLTDRNQKPFGLTDQLLEQINNPPAPKTPEVPTGIVSGWANWARQAEFAKSQAEKLNMLLGPEFGIGLLTTAIPGAEGFAKSLQSLFAQGEVFNPFRQGGIAGDIKKLEPKFAEALQAGSEEAYSLTLRNNFPIGSETAEPQKETIRKLDTIGNILGNIDSAIRGIQENVGVG